AERCPVLGNAVLVHQHGRRNRNGYEPVNDHQRQTDADEPDQGKNSETEQAEHSRLPIRCASEAKEKLPTSAPRRQKKRGGDAAPFRVRCPGKLKPRQAPVAAALRRCAASPSAASRTPGLRSAGCARD